jgi:hypothetical protein
MTVAQQQGHVTMNASLVNEQDFHKLVERRADMMLALLDYLAGCDDPHAVLTRPLLGEFLSQAMQIEELLDNYDAGKNCRWCHIRSLTATIKLFSDASYELMHIQHRTPSYRLMPVERDFAAATDEALAFTSEILGQASKAMIGQARQRGLKVPHKPEIAETFEECQLPGRLAHDCGARHLDTVAETVTLLATAFLNLASESEDVRAASRAKPQEYAARAAMALSEERLRSLEFQFHNLQSQYDTYVSGTQVENQDTDLPVLRGHASVVFHLLRTATLFAHYYERHLNKKHCATGHSGDSVVGPDALLAVLMNYSVTFIDLHIGRAVSLCQDMLKRYAEPSRIEVPIPTYRGFHVRPSTLISKIVLHYGSKVQMLLGDEVYEAGSSLDLFRANEKINAQKRRWLKQEIAELGLVPSQEEGQDPIAVVRSVVLALAERGKLVMYEQPLKLPEGICGSEGTLFEKVASEAGRLLAMGQIDISIEMNAQFVGDKRVLADIRILAENGYGEDSFGNNIPLPKKLSYLRR